MSINIDRHAFAGTYTLNVKVHSPEEAADWSDELAKGITGLTEQINAETGTPAQVAEAEVRRMLADAATVGLMSGWHRPAVVVVFYAGGKMTASIHSEAPPVIEARFALSADGWRSKDLSVLDGQLSDLATRIASSGASGPDGSPISAEAAEDLIRGLLTEMVTAEPPADPAWVELVVNTFGIFVKPVPMG